MDPCRRDSLIHPSPPLMDLPSKTTLPDLCEDVLLVICSHLEPPDEPRQEPSIKNLSLVNRRLRHILVPLLFNTLRITRPLSQLTPTPLLPHHATTCKIDMFGSMWWWCSGAYVCSADALALFRLIHTLKRVKTLEVMMMRRSVDMFTTAVASTPPQESSVFLMPRVEKLVVTSDAAFLVSQCPNLRDLVIDDRTNCLVGPYCSLPTRLEPLLPNLPSPALTHFDATAHWSVDEVRFLVLRFPALKYLRMRSDTYCYRASISAITSLLGTGLPHLKTLKLVKVGNLDTGYQSVWRRRMKGCSDAVYRKMLWRENEERRVEAENMVVRLAFGEIKGLGECWVGEGRVARRMDAEAWMWERRREDAAECGWDDPWASMAENEGVVVRREMGR